ncbi:tetratricopeptide repeat protein, partial [Acinetobacter baumannii]
SHEFPGKGSKALWDEANAYYIQGVSATQANKVDQSIAMYKKAISIYADDPDFQINLGVALEDKGSYKEAETVLNHALTLAPQNWT